MCIIKKDGVCYNHTFYINKIIKKNNQVKTLSRSSPKIFSHQLIIVEFGTSFNRFSILERKKKWNRISTLHLQLSWKRLWLTRIKSSSAYQLGNEAFLMHGKCLVKSYKILRLSGRARTR